MWSAGVIFFGLAAGSLDLESTPFYNPSAPMMLIPNIITGEPHWDLLLESVATPALRDLLKSMLTKDASKRPSAARVAAQLTILYEEM